MDYTNAKHMLVGNCTTSNFHLEQKRHQRPFRLIYSELLAKGP